MLEGWQLRIYIQTQALLVTVEGMKAENMARERAGKFSAYSESDFLGIVAELTDLERQLV